MTQSTHKLREEIARDYCADLFDEETTEEVVAELRAKWAASEVNDEP